MAIFKPREKALTRLAEPDLSGLCASATTEISEAVDYLDGNVKPHILEAIANRFAVELVKNKEENGTVTGSYRTRSKAAAKAAIDGGLFEVACTYLYQRINRERATLFAYSEEFEYSPAGIADDIKEAREVGKRTLMLQRLDWVATGTGSAAMLVQVLGNVFDYQTIVRDKIWIVFDEKIIDGDRERPVNTTNIEEASAVIIALSGMDDKGQTKYVAIFGRSEKFPAGRMVTYYANEWSNVPVVGADAADDYMLPTGEPVNPLTYWQNTSGDLTIPEYPVITWIGDSAGDTSDILPVDLGLYRQSFEYDIGLSRTIGAVLKSARGSWEFHRDQGAAGALPQAIDEGQFVTENGQSVKSHSISGANSESAMAVLKAGMADTAVAHGVPLYKLGLTADAAIQSGVALQIMNAPLMADRSRRIELNRPSVQRLFRIECALASMETGDSIGSGVLETWIPNEPPVYGMDEQQAIGATEELTEASQNSDSPLNVDASATIQQQVLNGAQVSSMVEIAQAVKSGLLTKEQGVALIRLSVPSADESLASDIAGDFDPIAKPVEQPAQAPVEDAKPKSRLLQLRGKA